MPKGKRKFIDRKNAVTFHLVHRSQQDPLIADETAPQHVLVPIAGENKAEVAVKKRKEEQMKYGVFFDDDYNYLQHLRNVSEMGVDWEPAPRPQGSRSEHHSVNEGRDGTQLKGPKIKLPSSVFASEIEEDVGLLNKAAPRSGLRLDLDPDVVAAMDDDFDFDNPDNILEDNFIELANDANGSDEEDSDVSSTVGIADDSGDEADGDDEAEDDIKSLNGSQFTFTQEETKSRFTSYSMSSSVIRRNEQLSLLDMRFEKLYEDYDDNEIGALDCEEIEGNVAPDSKLIMQYVEEFEREKSIKLQEADRTLALPENLDSDNSDMEIIKVPDREAERWDCESILSTYSNLYNHPKLITESQSSGRIKVSGRTGIPLDILDKNKLTAKALAKLDASNCDEINKGRAESVISMLSALSVRPKNETPDEKKDRKKAIKLYRKERRIERKANTQAFKEEKKRQEKILLNVSANQQGVKII